MTIRIGINGFGRMGRLALRAAWGWPDFEFVHVNEIKGGPEAAAHLLMFDSVHGRWPHDARPGERSISIDGKPVSFSAHAAPGDVSWADAGVDLVLEASGKFRTPVPPIPSSSSTPRTKTFAARGPRGSPSFRRRREAPRRSRSFTPS